jgi:DnaA family protein
MPFSQLTLDFGPPPPPALDNFVAGRNGECLAALRALLAQLRGGVSPSTRFIYVWGPAGSGKSHLAAALEAHEIDRLVVVDDCHRLSAAAQEQLFHRFNAMTQSPSLALVAFGDEPPQRLSLTPELASRLAWGIVFALQPLADDELHAAIEHAARERGLAIGADVVSYLLRHTRREMGGLKTLLDGLDRLALEQKRPITLPLLRTLLKGGGNPSEHPMPDRMPS